MIVLPPYRPPPPQLQEPLNWRSDMHAYGRGTEKPEINWQTQQNNDQQLIADRTSGKFTETDRLEDRMCLSPSLRSVRWVSLSCVCNVRLVKATVNRYLNITISMVLAECANWLRAVLCKRGSKKSIWIQWKLYSRTDSDLLNYRLTIATSVFRSSCQLTY